MSILLGELPSQPEIVHHRKPPQDVVLEATGFQRTPYTSKMLRNNRTPTREVQYSMPKKSESHESSLLTHFQKEAERQESASCVFLLWGSEDSESSTTWAVDVPTTDLESEDKIFQRLAERYAAERGFLRKWFSFRGFSRLKPVTFRLVCYSSNRFVVFMKSLDLAKYHKRYSEQLEEVTKITDSITDFETTDFPEFCYRDHLGKYEHDNSQCPVNSPAYANTVCPFEAWDMCNDQLRWIETAPFLSCYFRNPFGAYSQDILNGFSDHRFIYDYRNINSRPNAFQPQNRYLEFNGLYVETGFRISKCMYTFAGLLFCVIIGGKLIWSSWETTFAAGSFIVTFLMFVLAISSYHGF